MVSTHLKNMLVKLDDFPRDRGDNSKNVWNHHLAYIYICGYIYIYISGQIIIFHQPGFFWNKGISLPKRYLLREIGRVFGRYNLTRYMPLCQCLPLQPFESHQKKRLGRQRLQALHLSMQPRTEECMSSRVFVTSFSVCVFQHTGL